MAADKSVSVRVTGVAQVASAFRRVDASLPGELKTEFRQVAEHVAGRARSKVPNITGAARGSIKTRATSRSAAIAFGGQAAPYMPWLDFGGSVGRGHRPGQYWSGSIKRDWRGVPNGSGRYVYPAIAESRQFIADRVDEAIEKVSRQAGFTTKGHV